MHLGSTLEAPWRQNSGEEIYVFLLQVCVKSYNKWGWSILSEVVVIATDNVVGGYRMVLVE